MESTTVTRDVEVEESSNDDSTFKFVTTTVETPATTVETIRGDLSYSNTGGNGELNEGFIESEYLYVTNPFGIVSTSNVRETATLGETAYDGGGREGAVYSDETGYVTVRDHYSMTTDGETTDGHYIANRGNNLEPVGEYILT